MDELMAISRRRAAAAVGTGQWSVVTVGNGANYVKLSPKTPIDTFIR